MARRSMPLWLAAGLLCACASTPPDEPRILSAQVYIEADYDEVWRHVTEAEAIGHWYTAPCRSFSTRVGDPLVWAEGERVVYRGRLLSIEKGVGLRFEFRFVGFEFDEPMTPVEFRILEQGPTVLFQVTHDVSRAPATARIISAVGWTKPLSRLQTLLETGTPMPWPEDGTQPEG